MSLFNLLNCLFGVYLQFFNGQVFVTWSDYFSETTIFKILNVTPVGYESKLFEW